MGTSNHQLSKSLLFVIGSLLLLLVIAGGADTWAAPSTQGTVPTSVRQTPGKPPNPGGTEASSPPGGSGSSNDNTNPPPAGVTPAGISPFTCAVGGGDLNCTSNAGDLIIYFPPGSVPVGARATIAPVVDCPFPVIPPEYAFLGPCYDITVIGPDGKPITVFAPPLTLTIKFTGDEVAKAGGDSNRLYILYYDVPSGLWTIKDLGDRQIDTKQQQISVTAPHLSTYALFFQNQTGAGGPGTFLNSLFEFLRRFIGLGP